MEALEARVRACTLVGQAECLLRDGQPAGHIVDELQALERVYGLMPLFGGLPALLDRYSTVLQAHRELSS